MHIELIQSWSPGSQGSACTLADVQNVIKRLGIKDDGTQSIVGTVIGKLPAPKPKPAPVVKAIRLSQVQPGQSNSAVKMLQSWLALAGCNPGAADGAFGPKTKAAYAVWQRKCGYTGSDADGIPGKASLAKLAALHGYTVVA
jgi:peptidoglycan hydrolase-like protein with peptidoglycan-binding domain